MTNYSAVAQDLSSNLSLNKLKEIIEPFRDMKILIGITCRPEIKDYLLENAPIKSYNETINGNHGIELYTVNSQKESVKYWYSNQKQELNEYLKKNI